MKWARTDSIRGTRDNDGPVVVHGRRGQDVVNQLHEVGREALSLVHDSYRVGRSTELVDLVLVIAPAKDDPRTVREDDVPRVLLEGNLDSPLLADISHGRPQDVLRCVSGQGDVRDQGVVVLLGCLGHLPG